MIIIKWQSQVKKKERRKPINGHKGETSITVCARRSDFPRMDPDELIF